MLVKMVEKSRHDSVKQEVRPISIGHLRIDQKRFTFVNTAILCFNNSQIGIKSVDYFKEYGK